MILEEATKEAFGYYAKDLSRGSDKPVLATCELCGEFRITFKRCYRSFCFTCAQVGIHRTDITRALLSAAHKGNTNALGCKHSKKMNAKKSAAEKGKKVSDKTKALMSAANRGKKNSMYGKTGDKNPNWRGGVSFGKYCRRFNYAYKILIRKRFGNKCFLCNKSVKENGEALSVHHVNYNKNCGCDNTKCVCVPLCRGCHMRTNSNREYWQKKIEIKLRETLLGY
jgi:hypothetical protein